MKVRAQIAMVLDLDKCIACHVCSITCKNVWSSREGVEDAWFNNVETKPGVGYPKEWENQQRWNGGWVRGANGKITLKAGGRLRMLAKIFANPDLPQIDDYYEPFDFDYQHLHQAPEGQHQPTARPRSLITGQRMQKIHWGPNWEEILGTEFAKRSKDSNFEGVQREIYGAFEKTFMMYLPRLCEHCLNPACVASCPSGAIYKREEDGIVLIDQDRCKGYRHCIQACPYKKIYYNEVLGKSQKCIFCYPRLEKGIVNACAAQCPGRIRFVGLLDNPESPVHKLVYQYKIALGLLPDRGTGPNVYYVPPFNPPRKANYGKGLLQDPRIPLGYLRYLFGPAVDDVLRRLETELKKAQNGGKSEMLQLLIGRDDTVRYRLVDAATMKPYQPTKTYQMVQLGIKKRQ